VIVPRQDSTIALALHDEMFQTAVLCRQLLMYWRFHGRKDASLKPWLFTADGQWPAPEQGLDPYGIWIAETTHPSTLRL